MSKGRCLCGRVNWEFSGEPVTTYSCHCSMCRKAHGAAFGAYAYAPVNEFRWGNDRSSIRGFSCSTELQRPFCSTCGSVVPGTDESGAYIYLPIGCHDDGFTLDSHIFTASKAPWHDITDDLIQHRDYPPGVEGNVYPDRDLPEPSPGVIRGSCLCNAVKFEVLGSFTTVHNCHCGRCRRARAAPYTTNGFTSMDRVRFIEGEEHLSRYKLPDARYFTHVFCSICGSGLPRIDTERKIAITPLGALDDDPGCKPVDNIYVGSKAGWYNITDDLPSFEEGPNT